MPAAIRSEFDFRVAMVRVRGTSWVHPAVPVNGLVKLVTDKGETTELVRLRHGGRREPAPGSRHVVKGAHQAKAEVRPAIEVVVVPPERTPGVPLGAAPHPSPGHPRSGRWQHARLHGLVGRVTQPSTSGGPSLTKGSAHQSRTFPAMPRTPYTLVSTG